MCVNCVYRVVVVVVWEEASYMGKFGGQTSTGWHSGNLVRHVRYTPPRCSEWRGDSESEWGVGNEM
jgi:hypothetical protein